MIDVEALVKDFGAFRAVNKVSFSVPRGQILGFLGPNGAGKSTTMKMITGFLEPTHGTAIVGGKDILKDPLAVKRQIGYLPESAPSYGEMTVCEFLEFIAEMRGMRGAKRRDGAQRMRKICFLEEVWHQPIETLSKGYRQRVGFAQALIHDPAVLILDEPTDGLDPNQKFEVRQLIKQMGQDKTIILSTHILEEVEAVCERVVIISQGGVVADATPEKLMAQSRYHNAVLVRFADRAPEVEALRQLGPVGDVEALRGGQVLRLYPKDGRSVIDSVATYVRERGWKVEEIHVEQGRLDEVFRRVTLENVKKGVSYDA